ncbi:MAG: nitrilase-related carbon-nitrogen hydrolase [Candidatus Zhuqueibacterota bacterium]
MNIGLIQFDVTFGQPKLNIDRAIRLMEQSIADLWVLPELFHSGYSFTSRDELAALAEPIPDGQTCQALLAYAAKQSCAIVAGIAESAGGQFYNSAALITKDGVVGVYRKVHLFDREKFWFSPGDLPFSVHKINYVAIGMMICFDWLFPEAARTLALKGADVLCHPSNLVLPYCQSAMITRCLENRVFAITANRIGAESRGDGSLTFTGGSQIIDPRGQILFRAGRDTEESVVVSIDPELARDKSITRNNNALNDRRPDMYEMGG